MSANPRHLLNCHARGVHSIIIDVGPPLIRAFICEPHHTLDLPSVAFHRHRYDLELQVFVGDVHNVRMRKVRASDWASLGTAQTAFLHEFQYSPCMGAQSEGPPLAPTGRQIQAYISEDLLPTFPKSPLRMDAEELHTVRVPTNTRAVWTVTELRPRPDVGTRAVYADPSKQRWGAGMYTEIDDSHAQRLLDEAGVDRVRACRLGS